MTEPIPSLPKHESIWSGLFKAWLWSYFLPALPVLVITIWVYESERMERREKMGQTLVEGMEHELREGTASEAIVILSGVDRKKYEEYRANLKKQPAEEDAEETASDNSQQANPENAPPPAE